MPAKKLSPIEQYYEDKKKKIGRIFTSEEHRARGPEFTKPYFNTEVTRDTVTHFVDGIGDLNPLYRNREYGKKTKYKCLVAPPNFIYSITYAQYPDDWPDGISGFYSGSDHEWFRPLCEGDQIDYRVMYPSDVVLMPSKFAGQKTLEYEQCDYYRGGAIIGGYRGWETRAEDRKANEANKYKDDFAKLPTYTKEYIKEVHAAQDREVEMLRGAKPRYWEDVCVGDELTPVVRGPLTPTDTQAWNIGCHGNVHLPVRMTRIINEARRNHHYIDYDPTFRKDLSKRPEVALPYHFASGEMTEAWRAMVLTNWMGDDGFLWKSSTQIRKFNMQGDVTWCKGKVIKKYFDEGKYCVDIDCWCENQRGEITVPGTATIILPSQEHGPVVYPEPYARVPQS